VIRRRKEPTFVHRIFEHLRKCDDFRTARQLQSELNIGSNRVSAALHALRRYDAVVAMDSDGQLWWYATPLTDTRIKTVDERAPELKPRRQRKPRAKALA
jgi:hypothetical protein